MTKKQPEEQSPGQPQLTFEQAMAQLEQIIHDIETGEVGLEQSITQYEQGTKLITHCRAVLDRAEKKIRELGVTGESELTETERDESPADEEQEGR